MSKFEIISNIGFKLRRNIWLHWRNNSAARTKIKILRLPLIKKMRSSKQIHRWLSPVRQNRTSIHGNQLKTSFSDGKLIIAKSFNESHVQGHRNWPKLQPRWLFGFWSYSKREAALPLPNCCSAVLKPVLDAACHRLPTSAPFQSLERLRSQSFRRRLSCIQPNGQITWKPSLARVLTSVQ